MRILALSLELQKWYVINYLFMGNLIKLQLIILKYLFVYLNNISTGV